MNVLHSFDIGHFFKHKQRRVIVIISIKQWGRSITFNMPVDVSLDDDVIYSPEDEEYVIAFTLVASDETAAFLRRIDQLNSVASTLGLVISEVIFEDDDQEITMNNAMVEVSHAGVVYFFQFVAVEEDVYKLERV
jgi:hypothetical protein